MESSFEDQIKTEKRKKYNIIYKKFKHNIAHTSKREYNTEKQDLFIQHEHSI